MGCFCCKDPDTVDDKKNTFDIDENNIINDDDKNNNEGNIEKIKKIKKLQSFYRSKKPNISLPRTTIGKIIALKKDYTQVDGINDTLRKQLEEASIKENDLRSKIDALKEENEKLTQDLKKTRPYYRRILRSNKTYVHNKTHYTNKNNNKSSFSITKKLSNQQIMSK